MGKTGAERPVFWREHVRAWQKSEERRSAYCAGHGLNPQTFNVRVGHLPEQFQPTGTPSEEPGGEVRAG